MEASFSIVLCKPGYIGHTVRPPDNLEIYNFARIPESDRNMKTWVDKDSPFPYPIPVGTRWMYTVHPILESGEDDCPLKAGQIVAGPFMSSDEARTAADKVEKLGWFVCIYAALISDKSQLT